MVFSELTKVNVFSKERSKNNRNYTFVFGSFFSLYLLSGYKGFEFLPKLKDTNVKVEGINIVIKIYI